MKEIIHTIARCMAVVSVAVTLPLAYGGKQPPMKAIYDRPALNWEDEALPVGNGYMGAMIFGGVNRDIIQTNEKTLWSGGPGEDSLYNGGHLRTPEENHAALQEFRAELQKRMNRFDNSAYHASGDWRDAANYDGSDFYDNKWENSMVLNRLLGTKEHFGSFQTLSEIFIEDTGVPAVVQSSICANYEHEKDPGQRADKLFDGNLRSKWYADNFDRKSFPVVIMWEYTTAPTVQGYTLTSGNDHPVRDPKKWTLFASKDGRKYIPIDSREGDFWNGKRNESVRFELKKKTKGFKYFKLEIYEDMGEKEKPQLSEITLDFDKSVDGYDAYSRQLDLDKGMQTISYTKDGTEYRREYFMSYPDNIMVIRLTGDRPFGRRIGLTTKHSDYDVSASGNEITLTGWPTPTSAGRKRENDNWRNCLRFAQKVAVHSTDGQVSIVDDCLQVDGARELVLVMSAATNYQLPMDDSFDYFSAENPEVKAGTLISKASAKSYSELLATHLNDYQELFGRNSISLGGISEVPHDYTDNLLRKLTDGSITSNDARYLEILYYQFGRYLLISSSRPGSLPANLQGVWGDRLANAWNADYHTNINIQMNYWPAEPCNLAECHLPMVEFVKSLEPRGTQTARHYHCRPDGGDVRGWTAYHEVNAWANTAPAQKGTHSMFPEGAAWMCCDIWEHYLFNQDSAFLADYFDTMKNAALFWVDNLWTDERDGTLVANPSLSPEHGTFSLGCTASQGVIYELFDAVEKAAKILGRDSEPEIAEISLAKTKLSMPSIGKGGQFMEWKDEVMSDLTGDGRWDEELGRFVGTHRHTNHLFWLHPGSQVVAGKSDIDDLYAEAMKVTLNTRGDEGTGWSRAWKLNFWARLRDGDRAHKLLKSCMTLTYPGSKSGGVYRNLFDAHPPFQIDGNFGFTSGMSEMLLQSQGGVIELLPALPSDWNEGSFRGMCARGGFVVDADWNKGKVRKATIVAKTCHPCTVRIPMVKNAKIKGCTYRLIDTDTLEAMMEPGQEMTITYDD